MLFRLASLALLICVKADRSQQDHLRHLKQGKVEMCHIPPGNPDNAHTIRVNQNALKGHEKHEDLEGRCGSPLNCRMLCDDGDPCTDNSSCSEVNGHPSIQCEPVPVECRADGTILREQLQEQGTIPEVILNGFIPEFYEMIADHTQGRTILTGGIEFDTNTEVLQGEYGFPATGDAFSISGYFTPDLDESEDTTISAYTANGFASQSRINSGYFSLGITNVPPGWTPIILIVSAPTTGIEEGTNNIFVSAPSTGIEEGARNPARGQNPTRGRNLSDPLKVPCNIVGVNNGACAPSLDLKLTWDGPTSDVDLHVYEENGSGEHVYYGHQQGVYGYLNVDDVDGLGPEHYYANVINEPQSFKAMVHMYSYHADSIVNWQLEAKVEGESLWTESGTFDPESGERWSAEYNVALELSTCAQCQSLSNTGGRQLVLDDCCPPEQYEEQSFWCFFWCDDVVRPAYMVWESLAANTNPTVAEVKGLAKFVLGDRSGLTSGSARSYYDLGMGSIRDSGACLNDMWEFLLRAFCTNDALQASLSGIYEANNIISALQMIGTATTSGSTAEVLTEYLYSQASSSVLEVKVQQLKSYTVDEGILANFATTC